VVHAIAGENGAGKSTLMKILYGMARPDAGRMRVEGDRYSPAGPRQALARGVGMVHQHFMLIPTFTVVENAMLGREPLRWAASLDRESARRSVRETADRYGLDLDPDARVEELSVGERQRLEILKVLMRGARILILDEPTAVLVPTETRSLFATIRGLAERGATVLFITHRLGEVFEHADEVTVLRRGRKVGSWQTREIDERSLARSMVGRDPAPKDATPRRESGAAVLRLQDVGELDRGQARKRLKRISLEVRAGEIVGIAGVAGNGQRELTEIVAGLRPFAGSAWLGETNIQGLGPGRLRALGLAHIPEDRTSEGIVAEMSLSENMLLGREWEGRFRRGLSFERRAIAAHARERIEAFDIRPPNPEALAGALSGGNQQKIVISREAEGSPRLLLAAHPSRGVDVGASEAIHGAILDLRDQGAAVLLVSADLSEVLRLSDRILVLYGGEIVGEYARGEADEEKLGVSMVGGSTS
jgi:simple sugar transport system ATP-binding protein